MPNADKRIPVTSDTKSLFDENCPDGWSQDYYVRYLMGVEEWPDRRER